MKETKHLPLYGAGPAYVVTITILTLVGLFLHYNGNIKGPELSLLSTVALRIASILLIISGIVIWCSSVIHSRIQKNILENHLVTTGMYGIVRHPIYSAFTLLEWGLLLWTGNVWLFILIPVYWIYFTLLMKHTEEKWLIEKFGDEYREYSRRVNRCIPWFPRKTSKD